GARRPGQAPILYFDWSVLLLHELVSRNLGCIVVRYPDDSEPAGMLLTSGAGWRFAPFATQHSLAGVKLHLNPVENPSVRALIVVADWASSRTDSLLEFFPSASIWTAWSAQQQFALHQARLPVAQVG